MNARIARTMQMPTTIARVMRSSYPRRNLRSPIVSCRAMRVAAALALTLLLLLPAAAGAAGPPDATTGAAGSVAQNTATVAGTVNPQGTATTYHFEYGTSASYGLTTVNRDGGSGSSAVDVTADLTGLTTDTTYHYRLVATNAAGTTHGVDRT